MIGAMDSLSSSWINALPWGERVCCISRSTACASSMSPICSVLIFPSSSKLPDPTPLVRAMPCRLDGHQRTGENSDATEVGSHRESRLRLDERRLRDRLRRLDDSRRALSRAEPLVGGGPHMLPLRMASTIDISAGVTTG